MITADGTFTLCCIQTARWHSNHHRLLRTPPASSRLSGSLPAPTTRIRIAIILDNLSHPPVLTSPTPSPPSANRSELAFTPTAPPGPLRQWFLNHLQRDVLDLAVVDSVPELVALTKRYRLLYNRHRAKLVTMPGLGRFLDRVRTSKTGH
jgi:hypothetical protein